MVSIVELSRPVESHDREVHQIYLAVAVEVYASRRIRSAVPISRDGKVHQIYSPVTIDIPSYGGRNLFLHCSENICISDLEISGQTVAADKLVAYGCFRFGAVRAVFKERSIKVIKIDAVLV